MVIKNNCGACCGACPEQRDSVTVSYFDKDPYKTAPGCCGFFARDPHLEVFDEECWCCCVKMSGEKKVVITPFEKIPGGPCCCAPNRHKQHPCYKCGGKKGGNPIFFSSFMPQPKNPDAFCKSARKAMEGKGLQNVAAPSSYTMTTSTTTTTRVMNNPVAAARQQPQQYAPPVAVQQYAPPVAVSPRPRGSSAGTFMVAVPAGAGPGSVLQVTAPNGKPCQVQGESSASAHIMRSLPPPERSCERLRSPLTRLAIHFFLSFLSLSLSLSLFRPKSPLARSPANRSLLVCRKENFDSLKDYFKAILLCQRLPPCVYNTVVGICAVHENQAHHAVAITLRSHGH